MRPDSVKPVRAFPCAAVAAPVVLVGVWCAAVTLTALMGRELWAPVTVTLSEAVAVRDFGEAARLLGTGADPRRAWTVRKGLLPDRAGPITPAESAAVRGDAEMLQFLVESGLTLTEADLAHVRCIVDRADASRQAAFRELFGARWPECAMSPTP